MSANVTTTPDTVEQDAAEALPALLSRSYARYSNFTVAAAVIAKFGTGLGALGRFAATGAIVVPATYALAFLTYKLVELPGQRLGKAIIKRAIGRGAPRAYQTAPETIAAP